MAASKRVRRNDEITSASVRLIGADGEQVGILDLNDALEKAKEVNLDLVEVSPNAEPPVCRIMDFGKYLFEMKKKSQSGKTKQKQVQVKEIKFRPGTEEGDYQIKLKRLVKFLEQGDRTKITLRYRGREMAHQDLGMKLLKRVEADLAEYGTVEQFPKLEGRQLVMLITPKKS
ncbi:MAG: translation initiation factor IF-3 [Gammaproteobacteria bacterium]|nr:translation initiation factor IF-3 [Gammaproteobacteria bacterium]